MGSTKSPTTDDLSADSSAGSSPSGREVLRIGVILPTEERHPVRWLAARALGAELAWRNSPTDLQWFVQPPTASPWLHDTTVAINTVPENVSEMGGELDVVVGFIDSDSTYEFWVNPASAEMSMEDAVALIPRYLTPSLVEEAHPAPSLSESILVDVTTRCSDVVAAEVSRHALSRSLPISLIGPTDEQSHFATQLARHGQSATDVGTDLDPEQFGSLIQHSAVVVTSDIVCRFSPSMFTCGWLVADAALLDVGVIRACVSSHRHDRSFAFGVFHAFSCVRALHTSCALAHTIFSHVRYTPNVPCMLVLV